MRFDVRLDVRDIRRAPKGRDLVISEVRGERVDDVERLHVAAGARSEIVVEDSLDGVPRRTARSDDVWAGGSVSQQERRHEEHRGGKQRTFHGYCR